MEVIVVVVVVVVVTRGRGMGRGRLISCAYVNNRSCFSLQKVVQDSLWKLMLTKACIEKCTLIDCQLHRDRSGLIKHVPTLRAGVVASYKNVGMGWSDFP